MAGNLSKTRRSPAQLFALVFGVVYALTGVAGFVVLGLGHSLLLPKENLIIFGVNPLHNAVHLLVGLAWIAVSASPIWAKRTNALFGVVFIALSALGFMNLLGFLGISGATDPDNVLHLATAVLALYFGTVGSGSRAGVTKATGSRVRTVGANS